MIPSESPWGQSEDVDVPDQKVPPTLRVDHPDRSAERLLATAKRIEAREGTGFCVPGSAVQIYAEAFRALAREPMKLEQKG
jgi:hypothetical protein